LSERISKHVFGYIKFTFSFEEKMRKQILILIVFSVTFLLSFQGLYAFENKRTHPAITEKAAAASTIDGYLKTQLGLSAGLSTQLYWNFPADIEKRMTINDKVEPTKTKTVLDWLKAGSSIEDEDGHKHPARPRHHFYDPTRNAGLNNKDDNPNWQGAPNIWPPYFDLTGQSALTWAVDGTAPQTPTTNNQAWHNARADFYDSLTWPIKSDREIGMAVTFWI
jgi:hypothetical protein